MTEGDDRLDSQSDSSISDAMLIQILNAMSFSGEHEIARLATLLRTVRSFKKQLADSDVVLRTASEDYERVLCLRLHQAMQQVKAIDRSDEVNIRVLHRLWRQMPERFID